MNNWARNLHEIMAGALSFACKKSVCMRTYYISILRFEQDLDGAVSWEACRLFLFSQHDDMNAAPAILVLGNIHVFSWQGSRLSQQQQDCHVSSYASAPVL
jgi:hypothetical protein